MLTKSEIEELVNARTQDTNGATGEIPVNLSSSIPDVSEITQEKLDRAVAYAWDMFPSGGFEWVFAYYDYLKGS